MSPSRRSGRLLSEKVRQTPFNRSLIAETGVIPAGMQLIRDTFSFPIVEKKDVVVEGINGQEVHMMRVTGLIQNGDTENANGRFYSTKEVLAPAVKAVQEDIGNRAVMGEFDHPCITSNDFRVLTTSGWKDFADIKVGDKVYSRVNGEMVESAVAGIVDQPYEGKVYRFSGRHIETVFTAGHKVVMDDRRRSQVQATVAEIVADRKRFNKNVIPRTAVWSGHDDSTYTIPGLPYTNPSQHFKSDVTEDLVLDTRKFVAFLGIWLAEGNLVSNHGIFIAQKNGEKADQIAEMLADFHTELKWVRRKGGFYLSDARLSNYLRPLGGKYTKFIPDDVKGLDAVYLQELIHWFQVGDGRSKHGRNNVFTVSRRLIDDLHECHVKSGGCCYEAAIEPKADYQFAGRTILAVSKKVLYQLTLSQTTGIHMDDRFLNITEEHHEGRIYCLTTEHGNFYMQQNGRSFWTGNSDAKIHLDRVSHLMTKVWMDGKKVYGEAEVLHRLPCGAALRGLFEHKVRVGISSRGVGDMEVVEHNGHDVYRVMPGYSFVTWDTVAEPSVGGAILNIQEGLSRKLRPIKEKKHAFSEEVYQNLLVSTINEYFGLDKKKVSVPVRIPSRKR